jgi:hypothetical protein
MLSALVTTPEAVAAADGLYAALTARGVEVLFDDRDERPGVKFKDADLLGIPLRVTLGKKSLEQGKVELKARSAEGRRAHRHRERGRRDRREGGSASSTRSRRATPKRTARCWMRSLCCKRSCRRGTGSPRGTRSWAPTGPTTTAHGPWRSSRERSCARRAAGAARRSRSRRPRASRERASRRGRRCRRRGRSRSLTSPGCRPRAGPWGHRRVSARDAQAILAGTEDATTVGTEGQPRITTRYDGLRHAAHAEDVHASCAVAKASASQAVSTHAALIPGSRATPSHAKMQRLGIAAHRRRPQRAERGAVEECTGSGRLGRKERGGGRAYGTRPTGAWSAARWKDAWNAATRSASRGALRRDARTAADPGAERGAGEEREGVGREGVRREGVRARVERARGERAHGERVYGERECGARECGAREGYRSRPSRRRRRVSWSRTALVSGPS